MCIAAAPQDLMAPGRMWEEAGEHSKAIDAYLKVGARIRVGVRDDSNQ